MPANSDAENASITARAGALALLADKGFDATEVCKYLGLPALPYIKPEPKEVQPPNAFDGA